VAAAYPALGEARSLARPRPRTSRRSPRSSRNERARAPAHEDHWSGADPCPRSGREPQASGSASRPLHFGLGRASSVARSSRLGWEQDSRGRPAPAFFSGRSPVPPRRARAAPKRHRVGLRLRPHHRPPTHRTVRRAPFEVQSRDRPTPCRSPASLTTRVELGVAPSATAPCREDYLRASTRCASIGTARAPSSRCAASAARTSWAMARRASSPSAPSVESGVAASW